MAVKGIIVGQPYIEGGLVYLSVRVDGDGGTVVYPDGRVKENTALEYTASTPLRNPDGTRKPNAQIKSELVAAIKAQRANRTPSRTPIDFSGEVDVS